MKKRIVFLLNTMGWLMLFIAPVMGAVHGVGSDYELYFALQMQEGIPGDAGVGSEDLLALDARLSDYLFTPMNVDAAFDNRPIEVHGELRPPFNEKELIHLHDCRKLLSPTARPLNYVLLVGGGLLLALHGRRGKACAAWIATAVILLPLAAFGTWAALDFSSAFTFFHKILFTNDLWLLDPATDLLINICPARMFANMGLRIALASAGILLGVPLLFTLLNLISNRRKRKQHEVSHL